MRIGNSVLALPATFLISIAFYHGARHHPSSQTLARNDFSTEDVSAKLKKHVRSKPLSSLKVPHEQTSGTVAFFYRDEKGNRLAVIDWDTWVDGRHHVLAIDKTNYERSVVEE